MEINAALKRIHLYSPDPQSLASFYQTNYGMPPAAFGDGLLCQAEGRQVGISKGPAHQLKYALFELQSARDWDVFKQKTQSLAGVDVAELLPAPNQPLGFKDPDGNCMIFAAPSSSTERNHRTDLPEASLQHFALRTQNIDAMVDFYTERLGFKVSDRVQHEDGRLAACFLRTDPLHHALALFSAPVTRFDHHSFETPSWENLKVWADHLGKQRTEIVWGVGRHGPGNDVFFMVEDTDGNLVEISSEIERCEKDRPTGLWPHEQRTLNVWGKAIMRS